LQGRPCGLPRVKPEDRLAPSQPARPTHTRARPTAGSRFNPDGKLIGRVNLPERCASVCFGGLHRNRLFMASSKSVYALYVNTQGAAGG
jgi:SMP-30/Gluconolactonase/LRE-like region